MTGTLPHWAFAAACMAAALAGTALARGFERLPAWAEAGAVLAAGLVALWFGNRVSGADAAWTAALILPLAALAATDAAAHRLPDLLSFALIGLGLARLAVAGDPVLPPAGAAAGLVLLGLAIDRYAPDGPVGAGDLLIAAAALVWLGIGPLLELFLLAAVLLWLHFLALTLLRLAGILPRAGGGVPFAPAFALSLSALWIAGLPLPGS